MGKSNDCTAAGELIVGSMVPLDNIIVNPHNPNAPPEKAIQNILHVTSVGPDCKLQVWECQYNGLKARKIKPGDYVYVRAATTIPNTVDLNWLSPDMVIGLKEPAFQNLSAKIGK